MGAMSVLENEPELMSLLEVQNLKVHFPVRHGVFARSREFVKAVDGVSFQIERGETLGLVGESGCGKTTVGRAIVRLVEPTAGSIRFEGEDLVPMRGAALRECRRRLQIIFQDPYGSLNPRMTVDQLIGEALDIHRLAPGSTRRTRGVIRTNSAAASDNASASPALWPWNRS
jgi:ABC-type microcin C transport system duplicated ATPase subunit YejF